MTFQINNIISNIDTTETLTSFLNLDDKRTLRTTCTTFRDVIPYSPSECEAKTFLSFEKNRHLITEIVRMTAIYKESIYGLPAGASSSLTYAQRRTLLSSAWQYIASVFIFSLILSISLHNQRIEDSPRVISPGEGTTMSPEETTMLVTAIIVASYALPRFTEVYINENTDQSVPLMQLWYEFNNGEIPSDPLKAGDTLTTELQAHNNLAAAYQQAGGMDAYYALRGYTPGGLDRSFHEARSLNPRGALIDLSSL